MNLFLSNPIKYFNTIKFYKQFVGQNKLFFDIGANIGIRSEVFNRLGVKVVAVEPQSVCFKKLTKKFKNNKKVVLVNKCIGASQGEGKINICSSANVISSMSEKWKTGRFKDFDFDKAEIVKMITLEDLIIEHGVPDFCKIDVEGYDLEVVRGMERKIPCLNFEFTSEFFSDSKSILDKLLSLGFTEYNYVDGEKMLFELDRWVEPDQIIDIIEGRITNDKDLWGDIYAR